MNASRILKIAQPSLSSQLRMLEKNLNLKLFIKSGRRKLLSVEGERAFSFCKRIFEAGEDFEAHLKLKSSFNNDRMRIGVSPEVERPFVADFFSTLFKEKSIGGHRRLTMISADHQGLVDGLKNGSLDFVITNNIVYGKDVALVSDLYMPVYLVASPQFAKKLKINEGSTKLKEILKKSEAVLSLPTDALKLRFEVDSFLQKIKISNTVIFESDILAVVIRAVLEGLGMSFLPRPYIVKDLDQKRMVILGNSKPHWIHVVKVFGRIAKKNDETMSLLVNHFSKINSNF